MTIFLLHPVTYTYISLVVFFMIYFCTGYDYTFFIIPCICITLVLFSYRIKPGTQHIKLKQELEEKIAEQRSLEWAKRLEQEKQNQMELYAIRGDDEDLDDIDKIEAKLNEKEFTEQESSDEEEIEEEMEFVDIKEKPRKHNPLIADEAEESDCDAFDDAGGDENSESKGEEEDTEDSSEESDNDQQAKPKKGRILVAFEDSDDEDNTKVDKDSNFDNKIKENEVSNKVNKIITPEIKETQGKVFIHFI